MIDRLSTSFHRSANSSSLVCLENCQLFGGVEIFESHSGGTKTNMNAQRHWVDIVDYYNILDNLVCLV